MRIIGDEMRIPFTECMYFPARFGIAYFYAAVQAWDQMEKRAGQMR
jgi:hypothetical protein